MPQDKFWWKNAVVYEVYVDKFSQNFAGLTNKLDYLKFLGINCIHLLPHYPSPMVDDGYDVADYFNVRQELGTLQDFKNFIQKAHSIGIKVIVDFVLNHTSTKHPWFVEARSSVDNDKRNFYLWSKTGKEFALAPNLFPDLKDNNWIYNPLTKDYYFSTFHQEQADLNWNNEQVFLEMAKVLDFWIDIGVDGFRLDAVSHLIKKEGTISNGLPETHAIIKRLRSYINSKNKNVILLAEVGDTIKKSKEYFGNGYECHLVYNFSLVGQLLLLIKRGDYQPFKKYVESFSDIPESCAWANFLGHHDEMSLAMISKTHRKELFSHFDPENKWRFSEGISLRIATMCKEDTKKIIEAFKLLLSVPGVPIVYYGDEIGMKNEPLPPEEKDTRKSLRGNFDWNIADKEKLDSNSLLMNISNMIKGKMSEKT